MIRAHVDLVFDSGRTVRLECDAALEPALHAAVDRILARRGWWTTDLFEGCGARLIEYPIDLVNTRRVIGVRR